MASDAERVLDSDTRNLLKGPNFAHVATVMPDGAPQAAPVWIGVEDDDRIVFVKELKSVGYKNLRRDPRVGISINAIDAPYRCAYVRGRVIEFRDDQAAGELLDRLAETYLGRPYPPPRTPDCAVVVVEPTSSRTDDFSEITGR